MGNVSDMILYRDMKPGQIFQDMTSVMEHYGINHYNREEIRSLCFAVFHNLIELAADHGFEGNLWHNYLVNQRTLCNYS